MQDPVDPKVYSVIPDHDRESRNIFNIISQTIDYDKIFISARDSVCLRENFKEGGMKTTKQKVNGRPDPFS